MHIHLGVFLRGSLILVVELGVNVTRYAYEGAIYEDLLEEVVLHLADAHQVPLEDQVESLSAEGLVQICLQRPEQGVANDTCVLQCLLEKELSER